MIAERILKTMFVRTEFEWMRKRLKVVRQKSNCQVLANLADHMFLLKEQNFFVIKSFIFVKELLTYDANGRTISLMAYDENEFLRSP